MRVLTLNNALNQNNVWFEVTPEQSLQIFPDNKKIYCVLIEDNKKDYRYTQEGIKEYIQNHVLEQLQIIDEIPFKTQKEVWEFLISNEGNVVECIGYNETLSILGGKLWDIKNNRSSNISFMEPTVWKPSSELYKPKQKEWWELNDNKPTLCWYGDVLNNEGKYNYCGIVVKDSYGFRDVNENDIWTFAIPLTKEEIEEFIFKPLED
jgi:hypothetical protein